MMALGIIVDVIANDKGMALGARVDGIACPRNWHNHLHQIQRQMSVHQRVQVLALVHQSLSE